MIDPAHVAAVREDESVANFVAAIVRHRVLALSASWGTIGHKLTSRTTWWYAVARQTDRRVSKRTD